MNAAARVVATLRDGFSFRGWAIDANDGIIATAGLLQGFAGAGAGDRLLLFAAATSMIAGGLSAGGAKWAEVAAERDAQLAVAGREQQEIEAHREHELAEIAGHWESRGVEHALAQEVAAQLMARDPVAAGLDAEYGIEEVHSRWAPLTAGVETMLAFMIGASIPLLMTYYAPVAIETWAILTAVVVSLVLTSWVTARVGRVSGRRMLIRSLIVGLGTMGISYVAGVVLL